MLIIARFIGGVAVGELSEAKYRGLLSGLLQWMLSWGFLIAQWLGYNLTAHNFHVRPPLDSSTFTRIKNNQGDFRSLSSAFLDLLSLVVYSPYKSHLVG